jgi:phenylalanyl-tRNA synthetase beta chain
VLTAAPHPNADKLQVLSVDTGRRRAAAGGLRRAQCPRGADRRAGPARSGGSRWRLRAEEVAIRGVESNGMMCSTRELELGDDHDGIIELPADAPVGMAFAQYHGADPVFDVAITPNRPDCMGVYGIARDLAAAGLGTLKPIAVPQVRGPFPARCRNPHRRSRRLPGLLRTRHPRREERRSPEWMQARLKSAGPAADLGAGRHHQLRDAGLWPPGPRL